MRISFFPNMRSQIRENVNPIVAFVVVRGVCGGEKRVVRMEMTMMMGERRRRSRLKYAPALPRDTTTATSTKIGDR
jgi:hypothetical protein